MMEFTEEGVRVATDVFKSAIKSRRRFTYEEVDEYLAEKSLTTRPDPIAALKHEAKRRVISRRKTASFRSSRRKSTPC